VSKVKASVLIFRNGCVSVGLCGVPWVYIEVNQGFLGNEVELSRLPWNSEGKEFRERLSAYLSVR